MKKYLVTVMDEEYWQVPISAASEEQAKRAIKAMIAEKDHRVEDLENANFASGTVKVIGVDKQC